MSRIIDFYLYDGCTDTGHRLEQIWCWPNSKLEGIHDYIQWVFPTNEQSNFNPEAPVLDMTDLNAFQAIPYLKARLRRSFEVFLKFLGLKIEEGVVAPGDDFEERQQLFKTANHNWLRITRVIRSLRLLGMEVESQDFYRFLKTQPVSVDTMKFWEAAASEPCQTT